VPTDERSVSTNIASKTAELLAPPPPLTEGLKNIAQFQNNHVCRAKNDSEAEVKRSTTDLVFGGEFLSAFSVGQLQEGRFRRIHVCICLEIRPRIMQGKQDKVFDMREIVFSVPLLEGCEIMVTRLGWMPI